MSSTSNRNETGVNDTTRVVSEHHRIKEHDEEEKAIDHRLAELLEEGNSISQQAVKEWEGEVASLNRRESELEEKHEQEEVDEENAVVDVKTDWEDHTIRLDTMRRLLPERCADAGYVAEEEPTSALLRDYYQPALEDAAIDLGLKESIEVDPKLELIAAILPFIVMVFVSVALAMYVGGAGMSYGHVTIEPIKLLFACAFGAVVGLAGSIGIATLFEKVGESIATEEAGK